jgi:hypothetical protein
LREFSNEARIISDDGDHICGDDSHFSEARTIGVLARFLEALHYSRRLSGAKFHLGASSSARRQPEWLRTIWRSI